MHSIPLLELSQAILAVSLLLGATPALGNEAELNDLQLIVDGVNSASSEQKMPLLAGVFAVGARDHGWDVGTCPDAWDALSKRIPDAEKERAVLLAYPGCPAMCARSDIEATARAVVGAHPLKRTAVLVQACDAEGPEAVFSGERAWMRDQMSYWEYWAYRSMFDAAYQRLDAIGSEQAAATRAGFEELLEIVSRNLSRHLPPNIEGLELPRTHATTLPWKGPYSHVWITEDRIAVDGVTVCTLRDHRVPADQLTDGTISPLLTALHAAWESSAAAHEREFGRRVPFSARLLILPDRRVHAEVLQQVLQTASAARIWETQVAGYNTDLQRLARVRLELPAREPPGGRGGLGLTVEVTTTELVVRGQSASLDGGVTIRREDGLPDASALADLCKSLKAEWPDEIFVEVAPAPDVPYQNLVVVLDATRGPAVNAWTDGDRFPYAMLRRATPAP